MQLPLESITVGKRRREDFGDLKGLAASMERFGLLHPIVVDDEATLVAGERRLRAAEMLGWDAIDVRDLGELTEAERQEIELEENLQRKDLTAHERSKTLATLAETAKTVLREQIDLRTESVQKPAHRPSQPDSSRAVAERIGVPPQTIREAQQHVEIAEQIPVLAGPEVKQYHALEAREKLEKLPEPERPQAVALVNQTGVPPTEAIKILGNLAEMPPESRQRIFEMATSEDSRDRSDALTEAAKLPAMPDPRISLLIKALAAISQAERMFPDDPMNAVLANAKVAVVAARDQLRSYRRDDAA